MNRTLLPFFGVIRVGGAERADFLHNQLSNDIKNLKPHQACRATYNTARGRVVADMTVIVREDDILLIAAADLCDALVKRLKMFVLRAKVTLETAADCAAAGEIADSPAPFTLPENPLPTAFSYETQENGVIRLTLPYGGILLAGAPQHLPAYDAAVENAWHRYAVESGFAYICAATTELCVAQMINAHLLGAVHFQKGCYPGQEIIARAHYRGQVRRGPALYTSAVCATPADTLAAEDDSEAAQILNTVRDSSGSLNLCLLKHTAAGKTLYLNSDKFTCNKLFFKENNHE